MATIDYKQLATPEANLIELLSAQNQDGTYSAKLMGSEPFAVLAAKTIYNAYNDIEDNMAADVEGPASSTDNAVARFDGTTGKLIQNSNAILTDAGALSLASNLTVSGTGGVNVASNTKFWALNQAAYYYIPQSGSNTGDLDAVNGIRLLKGGTAVLTAGNSTDGNVTVTNNLTVSGGTIGTAASTNLTLNGGSSGASLVLGQGANGAVDITPAASGSGRTIIRAATGTNSVLSIVQNGYIIGSVGSGVVFSLTAGSGDATTQIQGIRSGGASTGPIVMQPVGGNLLLGTAIDGGQLLQVNGTAAISGALSIGNTVQTAVAVASTHKVTISIGGSTYYLLATNV